MARETCITVATGAPGTGKSTQTKKELLAYTALDSAIGRMPRKVLIMDTNNEYVEFQTVDYNPMDPKDNGKNFALLKNPEIRRISPFKANGKFMTYEEKKKSVIDAVYCYRNGLIFLEDFNSYILGVHKSEELVSALTSARHKGTDIMIHVQNLSAIEPRMWNNITYVRFHYQAGPIKKDGKVTNFELMRIAQYMVNYMYGSCACEVNQKCSCGKKYFYLYVNVRTNKIRTNSKALYEKGVSMYRADYRDMTDEIKKNQLFYLDLVA